MSSDLERRIRTAFDWQASYKEGFAPVEVLYATQFGRWPEADGKRGLTAEAVAEWRDFLRQYARDGAELAPLDTLRQPGARVVVTGQQAGAGLGHLYVLYKAFAAKYWAARISEKEGVPCVPVFWVASDDHDLAEVAQVEWLTASGEKRAVSLAPDGADPTRPVFDQPMDRAKAAAFLDELKATTHDTEFRGDVLKRLEQAFQRDGATFESQFLDLFCSLLLRMGIMPMVPRLGFVRRGQVQIMEQDIRGGLASTEQIMAGGKAIEEIGLKAPLHRSGNELNFFLQVDGMRGKVVREGDAIAVLKSDESKAELARMSEAEAVELLHAHPERFSPNAALRPLVQDTVFPSAVYIAGPTEMVYHAQIRGLYKQFNVPRPAVFPRPSAVLLDTKTEKAIGKLGLDANAAAAPTLEDFEVLLREHAAQEGQAGRHSKAIEQVEEALRELDSAVSEFTNDTGVNAAVKKLRDSADKGLEKLRDRLDAYKMNLDSDKVRAREKVIEAIYPGGAPQERSIGPIAPLLVQYGVDVLGRLYTAIDYEAKGFQVVSMKGISG